MTNFFTDNKDIQFHLKNMDLSRVADLKEDGFADAGEFPEAPADVAGVAENYQIVLDIVGEIAGDFVDPRSRDVDEEGATYKDGEVIYAKGTAESIDRLIKADLMGFTLPRRFNGINMPKTVYTIATEMISRADASLMNVFGLQEISDTISKFGSEDQKERYLPRFCSGEVMGAMDLTEPDAGSDLQAVMLKATETESGSWLLNGSKRFITNGCAEIGLIMARSEAGTKDGRGISLFIYERDANMKIRRIEHKLGIKGSPTCELQFNDAESELLGKRKMGLIKYTMSLMNGARLAVAAQGLGIAEAAYRKANQYATEREQFKKPIRQFSAVYEMLTDMKVSIEAGRSLLYDTARIVDIKEGIEDRIEWHPETKKELKADLSYYSKLAALFTPIAKAYNAEMSNKVCYDGIQIHGGVGFTTEFDAERHYRDARITNIYEGTTQLQVVAAIGGVIAGVASIRIAEYEEQNDFTAIPELIGKAKDLKAKLEEAVTFVKEKGDREYQDYHAGRLVGIATDAIISYLLCIDALQSDRKKKIAELFLSKAVIRVDASLKYILSDDLAVINLHKDVLEADEEI